MIISCNSKLIILLLLAIDKNRSPTYANNIGDLKITKEL